MAKRNGAVTMFAIPTFGNVHIEWAKARAQIASELGSSVAEQYDLSPIDIATKRNHLVRRAQEMKVKTIFFIGDDVIVPANALHTMLTRWRQGYKAITGIYWTKGAPSQPYIFRDYLRNPFYDWHVGELFPVSWAGCDCLFLDMEIFDMIEPPWFSLDYLFFGAPPNVENTIVPRGTEDLYFFTKLKKAGIQLWCDASLQCGHIDRDSNIIYSIPFDWPQAKPGSEIPRKKDILVAEIGCGNRTTTWDLKGDVVRFDIDEDVNPDVRCDIRSIPEPANKYDVAHASHVLEHIPLNQTIQVITEWARVLKAGGILEIELPNILWAAEKLVSGNYTPYVQMVLYGSQATSAQTHMNGFTPETLQNAVMLAGNLEIEELSLKPNPEPGAEIYLRAKKIKATETPDLSKEWEKPEGDKDGLLQDGSA